MTGLLCRLRSQENMERGCGQGCEDLHIELSNAMDHTKWRFHGNGSTTFSVD